MNKTMNDAQRKLAADNHNLIYSFLKSRHLSLDAIEDWYGTAAIGLCKAALIWDEKRGVKFPTLAYFCMNNEVGMILRKNRKDISPTVSLDDEFTNDDGSFTLSDIIPDKRDPYAPVYIYDAIEIAARDMSERDKKILDMIVDQGMTHTAVAAALGIAQPTVSHIYRKFFSKIREYLAN